MSIFNGTFTPVVKSQIQLRQTAKSAIAPSNNSFLVYNHAKTSWARLTSSVDSNNSSALAKSYILEGGTLQTRGNQVALKSGVGNVNGAYDNTDLGLRPMPGITSVSVNNSGFMGSLRQATIKFQCWSMEQLDSLEKLYMRPGYSCLLEWGVSHYLDNSTKNLIKNNYRIDIISDNRVAYEKILQGIDLARNKSCGNYDALFGLVQNFTWNSNNSNGYDCSIDVISVGFLLESMKINYVSSAIVPVSNGKAVHYFGNSNGAGTIKINDHYKRSKLVGLFRELLAPHYISGKYELNDIGRKYNDQIHQVRHIYFKNNQYSDPGTNKLERLGTFYMPLDTIVEIINEYILLRNSKDDKIISKISTKDKYGNDIKCVSHRLQTSVDPLVCIVHDKVESHTIQYNLDGVVRDIIISRPKLTGGKIAKPLKYYYNDDYSTGNIGNIYIGIEYFIYTIQSNINVETNTIDVYSALKKVLEPIQQALGGINKFDIFIDPDDNVARIIDYNYVEENRTKGSKYTLKTTGLESIVRNKTLSSSIFPEAATMISIAARGVNSDNTMGLDVDSLIRFNQGLTDRIFPSKITPENSRTLSEQNTSKVDSINDIVEDLNHYSELISSTAIGTNVEEIKRLMSTLIHSFGGLLTTIKKLDTTAGKKINNFIIPIKLTLTIDGLAGINIGEVFTVPYDELPSSYKSANIGFIVMRVNHEIQNNDWVTNIETQTCILD